MEMKKLSGKNTNRKVVLMFSTMALLYVAARMSLLPATAPGVRKTRAKDSFAQNSSQRQSSGTNYQRQEIISRSKMGPG